MLSKKRPLKLLPPIAGMLDGASHPINPNPITFRSLRSQSLSKLTRRIKEKQIKQPLITVDSSNSNMIIITFSTYHMNFPP
jgi:hypothetical protein